mgnify:CR=1 FL=1
MRFEKSVKQITLSLLAFLSSFSIIGHTSLLSKSFLILPFVTSSFVNSKLSAQTADSFYQSGLSKLKSGKAMDAFVDFNKAYQIEPENPLYNYYCGMALSAYGLHKEAIGFFNNAIKFSDNSNKNELYLKGSYLQRGNSHYQLGDPQSAFNDFSESIKLDPKFENAYFSRAILLGEYQDDVSAIADWNKLIALNPKNEIYFMERAISKSHLGQYADAAKDFAKAIKINPNNGNIFSNKGVSLYKYQGREASCNDFKKAASLGDAYRSKWLQTQEASWCRNM